MERTRTILSAVAVIVTLVALALLIVGFVVAHVDPSSTLPGDVMWALVWDVVLLLILLIAEWGLGLRHWARTSVLCFCVVLSVGMLCNILLPEAWRLCVGVPVVFASTFLIYRRLGPRVINVGRKGHGNTYKHGKANT